MHPCTHKVISACLTDRLYHPINKSVPQCDFRAMADVLKNKHVVCFTQLLEITTFALVCVYVLCLPENYNYSVCCAGDSGHYCAHNWPVCGSPERLSTADC